MIFFKTKNILQTHFKWFIEIAYIMNTIKQ